MWKNLIKGMPRKKRFSWSSFLLGAITVTALSPWARRQLKRLAVTGAIGTLNAGDQMHKWSNQVKDSWDKMVKEIRGKKCDFATANDENARLNTKQWQTDFDQNPEFDPGSTEE
ncbi:MAG: hypothetical protein GX062_02380 [Firmicutes bacterium]|jgi:DUF917 family protein|nr:hypothetical protein [Bacillota bacterium]